MIRGILGLSVAAALRPLAVVAQQLPPVPSYAAVALPIPASTFHVNTTEIPKTYWLEGGIVGGTALGLFTVAYANGMSEGSGPNALGNVLAFMIGASVGFPAGALIGGQFHKHG